MRSILLIIALVFLTSCDKPSSRKPSSGVSTKQIAHRRVDDPLLPNTELLNLTTTSLNDVDGVDANVGSEFKGNEMVVDLTITNQSTHSDK